MKNKLLLWFILFTFGFSLNNEDDPKMVLFLGDSLAAGYGLQASQAFPALIQQKIDALDWNYKVINAGLSGDTSAGGLRRIDWLLRGRVDVLVLELGANDGLRGIDLSTTKSNLQGIIDKVKARNPQVKIVIAGMMVPPNLGQDYTRQFQQMYPDLAKSNTAVLIPFLLEGVAGEASLNLPDGIHPTAEGHKLISETVWTYLRPVLQSAR
jgi:acyl-CoA thioesterase-1